MCFIPAAYSQTLNGWLKWNGNEYSIVLDRMSIEQARQHCKKKNGDLVSITSEVESILLWNLVSETPCQENKVQQDFSLFFLVCAQISTHERLFWIGLTVDLDKTAV